MDIKYLQELGQQLRVDSVRAAGAANSGHPTSSMSAADLMAVLMARNLRYDFSDPKNANNDHLIFSKGHASPLLYAMFKAAGVIGDEELFSFRKLGSDFQGHPTPILPWVDVATGSLGQGLPIGVGVALAGKYLDRLPYRVWVLCGDSEMAEGSMWEAFEHASHAGLDNLTAIIDVNRLGQRGETMHGWNLSSYAERARASGWHAIEIDGHDIGAVADAYDEASSTTGKPTVIVARTLKGRGVKAVEDMDNAHGKPVPNTAEAVTELGGIRDLRVDVSKPETPATAHVFETSDLELPVYAKGKTVATRQAYGEALTALGKARGDVVTLDGEVSNSTFAEVFAKAIPERYFEMFIAEQQMVASAVGLQVRGWRPFASTFAAFLSRAFDFVRMAAISQANICLAGSHAGVSIGEDGPSQMALEDIAMMRAIHGSAVLHPCDANQTAQLVVRMAKRPGINYIRTLRGVTPVIYGPDESFDIGGSNVLRSTSEDQVTIVAAGVTVPEALKAAEALFEEGITARVIDAYSIKPIDVATLRKAAAETSAIMTVEDHWPEGGLGDAVLEALADAEVRPPVIKLAVRQMPGSGKPDEMLAFAEIDAAAIVRKVRSVVSRNRPFANR